MTIFVFIYSAEKIEAMARFDNTIVISKEFDIFTDKVLFETPKVAFGLSSFPPDSETDNNPDFG